MLRTTSFIHHHPIETPSLRSEAPQHSLPKRLTWLYAARKSREPNAQKRLQSSLFCASPYPMR